MIPRYFVRKEHFGAVLYDTLEFEYLFADHPVAKALLEGDVSRLHENLHPSVASRGRTLFRQDGTPDYEVLDTPQISCESGILSAPLQIYFDFTTLCNLRCKHCYTSAGVASVDELALAEIERWAAELRSSGVFKVSIGGGEPLLRPDALRVLKSFRRNDIAISLSTNATLLTEEWIDRLNGLDLRTLSISMEGGTREHYEAIRGEGSWNQFVSNVSRLNGLYRNRFAIRVTITRQTLNDVDSIVEFARRIGAYAVKFKFLQFEGRALLNPGIIPTAAENLSALHDALAAGCRYGVRVTVPTMFSVGTLANAVNRYLALSSTGNNPFSRRFGCGGAHTGLYVSPDGTYSACVSMGKDFNAGNLKHCSLQAAWHAGVGMIRMRSLRCPAECGECTYLHECKGGCRARSLQLAGDAEKVDPYCPFHRSFESCAESPSCL